MNPLDIRKEKKAKKPAFSKQDVHKKPRLSDAWRKPTGGDSKVRLQLKGYARMVKPGYGSPAEVRGLTRDGLQEVLIANVSDVQDIKEGMVGVIVGTVGMKKRLAIIEAADKANVQIANKGDVIAKAKAKEEAKKAKQVAEAKKKKAEEAKKVSKPDQSKEPTDTKEKTDTKEQKTTNDKKKESENKKAKPAPEVKE